MAITTTSIVSPAVEKQMAMKLLSTPVQNHIHKIAAENKVMGAHQGNIFRQRRYNSLGSSLVPLGNSGIPNAAKELSTVDIDAKIDYYGDFVVVNEQVIIQNQEDVINNAILRLGVGLRDTEDELTRDMLLSTVAFINCVGGTNGDTPTDISVADVDDVVSVLLNNDAKTISDSIEGEDKFGTAPVRDAYFGMASSRLSTDLNNVNGFIHKNQYPSPMNALKPEWGAIGNVRFLLSSAGAVTATASNFAADVFDVIVTAMEGYSCIEQNGYSSQMMVTPQNSPYRQNVFVAYKMSYASVIQNDEWVIRLRCTLS